MNEYLDESWNEFWKYVAEENWNSLQSLFTELDEEYSEEVIKMQDAMPHDKWKSYYHWVKVENDKLSRIDELRGK